MTAEAHYPTFSDPGMPEVVAQSSGAELFAEHVALVRDEGDALDAQRRLWCAPLGRAALATAIAGSAIIHMEHPSPVPVMAAAVTSAAWGMGRSIRGGRHESRARARMAHRALEANGSYYELYRVGSGKDAKIAMWLYGALPGDGEDRTASEFIRQHAELAKSNNVDTLMIGTYTVRSCAKEDTPHYTESVNGGDWLRAHKKLRTTGYLVDDTEFFSKTPDTWLAFADSPRRKDDKDHQSLQDTFTVLHEKLGSVDAEHKVYREGQSYTNAGNATPGKAEQLVTVLEDRLQSYLNDVSSGERRGERLAFIRRRQHSTGEIVGDQVIMRMDGRYDKTIGLEEALGLTKERIALLRENPKADRTEAVRVLEYLMYGTLSKAADQTLAADPKVEAKAPQLHHLGYGVQEAVHREGYSIKPATSMLEFSLRRQKLVSRGLAAGIFAAAAASVIAGTAIADGQYTAREREARAQIAAERVSSGTDEKAIRDRVHSWSVVNGPWGAWRDAREWLSDPFEGGADIGPNAGDESSAAVGELLVGNLDPGRPDHVVWELTRNGKPSTQTSEYWYTGTSWSLVGNAAEDGKPAKIYWEPSVDYPEENISSPPIELDAVAQQIYSVKVRREISENDFTKDDYSGRSYLRLPVLEGAAIKAAHVDGKQVKIVKGRDNSYALLGGSDNVTEGELEYWVQFTGVLMNTMPFAVRERAASGTLGPDTSGVLAIMQQVDPDLVTRREDGNYYINNKLATEYIKNNFTYDEQPLHAGDMRKVQKWPDFQGSVFEEEEASCTTATTVLALADKGLNASYGFLNAPDKNINTLTSKEAHMWAVDKHRQKWDSTPERVLGPAPAGGSEQGPPVWPLLLMPGVLALGASLYAHREAARRATRRAKLFIANKRADRAEAELRSMHPSVLRHAIGAVSAVDWGDPLTSATEQARLYAAMPNSDPEAAYAAITTPSVYDSSTAHFFEAHKILTPAARRALRLARRVAARPAKRGTSA